MLQTLSLSNATPDDNNPYMLRQIRSIEVSNFKSFEGYHVIGPFSLFTFVIGPNGGGKSNVLDAISFVLGLGLKDLRCRSYDQLIYNKSVYYETTKIMQQDHDAYVEIVFEPSDLRLKRTLQLDGNTQVYLNNVPLSQDDLSKLLVSSNLMARNFIMLQGDTDKLTTLEPLQLTEYFEKLSGSIRFKEQYEKLLESLTQIKQNIRNLQLNKLGLKQEHKKVKDLRSSAQFYQQLNNQINECKKQLYLKQLWDIDKQKEEILELMNQQNDEKEEQDEKHRIITSLQQNDLEMKQVKREMNLLNQSQSEQLQNKMIHLKRKVEIGKQYQKQINQLKQEQKGQMEMIDEIQMDINQLEKVTSKIPKEFKDEYNKLLNQLRLPQSLIQQCNNIDKIISSLEQQVTDSNQNEQQLVDIQSQLDYSIQKLQATQERLDQLAQTYSREQQVFKDLLQDKSDLEKQIQISEYQLSENIEEEETRQLVQQLYGMFPQFIGELSSLCNPVTPQYAIPLKVALGQRLLRALIITSSESAPQINKFLKSIGMVKELILLDKVKTNKRKELHKNNDEIRSTIQGIKKCVLAVDVIELQNNQLQDLIEDLLKGVLICDNYQNAVLLQKRQIKNVKNIITFDGYTIQSSGMILYQSNVTSFRNFRLNNQRSYKKDDLQKQQKQLDQIKEKITQLKEQSHTKEIQELSGLKGKLEEQIRELEVQIKWCKMNQKKGSKNLQEELNQRKLQREEIQLKINEQQNQCKEDIAKLAKNCGISEEELRKGDNEIFNKKYKLLDLLGKNQQKLKDINQKLIKLSEEQQELLKDEQELINIEQQLVQTSQKKEQEKQLKQKLKQLQDEEKSFLKQRDQLVKRSSNRKQEINSLKRKQEILDNEKNQLIEECDIESIEINKNQDKIIYPEDINNTNQQELQQLIKQKEKQAEQHLSDNLQTGLIGSEQKFNQIEIQLKQLQDKLLELHEEQNTITEELGQIKKQRIEKFNELFEKVNEEVQIIYETLTFQNQLKGSAVLYLENKDEPFNGGIIYTPTPPNKRYVFDNQEQLSGGEKAMASLALFFALNSAIGCPFILLDEVDANLDSDNVQRLRLVMQAQTETNNIQFISISHNQELFQHGNSLIGITIQSEQKTSEAFSVKL